MGTPVARDIAMLFCPPWDSPARFSKHHLAAYLAERGHHVLFVEAPLGPLSLLRRRTGAWEEFRATVRPPHAVAPRLWARRHFNPVPYHAVTRPTSARAANRLGQRLLAPVLRRDFARLGFQRPVLIAGLPHAADLVPRLPHQGLVYHCADDFLHATGFPPTLAGLERDLCQMADLVVTTSATLRDDRLPWNPHTVWIPNGVELDRFLAPVEPAAELAGLPRPLVGFVGGLASWVDVPLLADLARARPGWSLVLVGPAGTDLSPLRDLPNVHLLGPRPYEQVPAYLAAFDVALIPFRQELLTHHADPIKAYEYLAAGVPVVATDLPALRRLGHTVRLADSSQAFLRQVDAAVALGREHGRAERQAEARRHSWASRFEQFEALLDERVPLP